MIINADDFGFSSDINRAVIDSFKKKLCSNTTIMANMPGFDEACQLVHEHKLLNYAGIHFVLTEGVPLTDDIKKCSRFCNSDGILNMSRGMRFWRLNIEEKRAIAKELRAQIGRCREYGLTITHADSHRHAHEEWAIAHVVIDLCRSEGIPYLRLARNCGQGRTLAKRMYRHILNRKIRKAGLSRTMYFGSAKDVLFLFGGKGGGSIRNSIEIMIHPGYDEKGALIERTDGLYLSDIMSRFI